MMRKGAHHRIEEQAVTGSDVLGQLYGPCEEKKGQPQAIIERRRLAH